MKRDNPLPLLFAFAFLFVLSNVSVAQTQVDLGEAVATEAFTKELDRIEQKVSSGPHYKNRNAAGRLLTLNRAVPNLPADYAPVRIFGPAYKNRKIEPLPQASERPRAIKPRLTGPRYKNRGAKTGGL